ncbi:GlsB/YeaQ/YmgE family stress response membrane protein [Myxococcus sp. RHST-1-4]|nr:GlsB/YeaQ/YmgE family stress response membrane protein [Myxococcus sp. RHSTA-1-4]
MAILVLAGTTPARGQEVPENEPAQAPPADLTPPPLLPVPPPGAPDGQPRTPGDEGTLKASGNTPAPSVSEGALPSRDAARAEDPVPRVAVELVGGTAGGLVLGTVGLLAGYLISAPTVGCDECRVVSLVGGATGVLLGIPTGTWVGGRLMGGKGHFFPTVGGSAVGWGGALLGSLLLGSAAEDDTLSLLLLLLPVAGATTGYELSHASERHVTPPPTPRASGQFHVLPVAGMTERGPRLGLMGRF